MKKLIIFFLVFCLGQNMVSQAQTLQDSVNKALINGQKSVTGLAQDVLNNYLQVAAKNLLSNNSNLQLKLTYFALSGMDSVHKYNNDNFLKTKWQRNLEFTTAVGVDKGNDFNSFKLGAAYNFWNRRDVQAQYLTDTYIEPYNAEQDILFDAVSHFRPTIETDIRTRTQNIIDSVFALHNSVNDLGAIIIKAEPYLLTGQSSDGQNIKYLQEQLNLEINNQEISTELIKRITQFARYEATELITVPLNTYVHDLGKSPLAGNKYLTPTTVSDIAKYIDQKVVADPTLQKFKAKSLSDLNNKVLANYQAMLNYIGRQPLLTFNYLYSYGKGTLLSNHLFGLSYLQGTGGKQTVKLGQIKASLTDTLTGDDPTGVSRNFNRNIVSFQAGYNQVLAMQRKVSIMELNVAVEQDWATNGYIAKDITSRFYFDAYYRVRLPTTPWLKFDLKYDPKGGSVLGLLDFTYNLDKQ